MTPEEYLAFERASNTKHEYINGEVVAMTGASRNHNRIAGSAYAALYAQLRNRPCDIFPSDMRVKTGDGEYTYPDISIVCGDARFEDDVIDTLLNPTVIIEVLSPSTAMYDRGTKFHHYRTIESLQEYVMIAQDSIHIEHYVRQGEHWLLTDIDHPDTVVALPSIDCTLAVSDVYEKVTFTPEEGTTS
ncbi:MAG: Uma2 family endonuclease [Chloroflexi bacterium]|nr:Uma2 family endonuclease [Chloroflexota bacterium]